jgi:N-acylglucosamine 2-epimerase
MTKAEIQTFRALYEKELFDNIVPFWEKYSLDRERGGYLTCIERDGRIFDHDKFIWMQGRELGPSRNFTILSDMSRNGLRQHI